MLCRCHGQVSDAAAAAKPPYIADQIARGGHQSLGHWDKGWWADWVRTHIFDSGPISTQRWMRRGAYRKTTDVAAVVDKSVEVAPIPSEDEQRAKYEKANPGLAKDETLRV